jgi:hypothetical protein
VSTAPRLGFDSVGKPWLSEEVERFPKGFFRIGYGELSSGGTGGVSEVFALLKALRIDAKDGFFEKPVTLLAKDGWAECENTGLLGGLIVAELVDSTEADESPRLWEKKLLSDG